jgi:hypothetical protein
MNRFVGYEPGFRDEINEVRAEFNIFLTVHLGIILVGNQTDAQYLL